MPTTARIVDETIAKIILMENSTACNPPKTFLGQKVKITHEDDIVSKSIDGYVSYGRQPSEIFWSAGVAKHLENITNVKIVGNNGEVLIDGELCNNAGLPRDVKTGDGEIVIGVIFYVLKPDD